MNTQSEREGVRIAVRELLRVDRAGVEPPDLTAFQKLFPGYGDIVAEEFAAAAAATRAPEGGAPPAPGRTITSGPPAAVTTPDPLGVISEGRRSPERRADRIGHYVVVRELGRGGMGVVYEAQDTLLPRRVALKVLSPQFASSTLLRLRFQREAELASKLDHPHICTVYEAGEDDGAPFLAMRFVEGRPLADLVASTREETRPAGVVHVPTRIEADAARSSPPAPGDGSTGSTAKAASGGGDVDLNRVLVLFEKAARALHHAHERGLIHRDVKPHNIMVTPDGEPVLLDFGLAREEGGEGHQLTQTGSLMGTPAYMSPEQLTAQHIQLDRRTDVYSMGVALYECLTLKLPFDAPTVDRLYQKILATDPEDPRSVNRALPEDLVVVLETALEKDRDRRYQTALDLAEELRRVREHEPIRARHAGRILRLRRWGQRNRAVSVLLVLLVLGLSAAVASLSAMLVERESREQTQSILDARQEFRREAQAEVLRQAAESMGPSPDGAPAAPRRAFLFPRSVVRSMKEREVWGLQLSADGEMGMVLASIRSPAFRMMDIDIRNRPALYRMDTLGGEVPVLEDREIGGFRNFVLSPDEDAVLCSGPEGVRLLGMDGVLRASFGKEGADFAGFSSDGARVVAVEGGFMARLWESDGSLLAECRHGTPGSGLYLSEDERARRFLTHSLSDGSVRLWTDSGKMLWEVHPPDGNLASTVAARLFPSGDRALIILGDGTGRIHDAAGGLVSSIASEPGGPRFDTSARHGAGRGLHVAIRGGLVLANGSDGRSRLWDSGGRLLGEFPGTRGDIHPGGRCVATIDDGTIRLWALDGTPLLGVGSRTIPMGVRFHGSGRILLSEHSGMHGAREFTVWDCFLDYR